MTTRLANCKTVTTLAALMAAQQGSPNASLPSRLLALSSAISAFARLAVRSALPAESRRLLQAPGRLPRGA
jgi:hypothetical protein